MTRFATIGLLLCWLVVPAAASPPRGPREDAVLNGAVVPSERERCSVSALLAAWGAHFDALVIMDPQVRSLTIDTWGGARLLELPWGATKMVLDFHDVVIIESRPVADGPWVIRAHGRRNLAQKEGPPWRGAGPPPPPVRASENRFRLAQGEDLRSTFSVDVDTASYSNVRRFLRRDTLPPPELVRVEEMVNYFPFSYASPQGPHPFRTHVEVATCPWATDHHLVRIGLKGRVVEREQRPPSNLVFLIDVSGSMSSPDKLPLLKESLRLLVAQLGERDRVSIVTYAGASGLALPPTSCSDPTPILATIDRLEAGGSTNGGSGIQLAYRIAIESFAAGGVNRVILATDGDWNVGVTSSEELETLIERKARSGVFLSVLGFGAPSGDHRMETLADKGNGAYASIDTLREARKALVAEVGGTLVTIAKDVKVQIEFDPREVRSYRLVGYENRALANHEFADDEVDAGEIGAGHTVTAIYEVVLNPEQGEADGFLEVALRYKQPTGAESSVLQERFPLESTSFDQASADFRFASAVAAFGLLLRGSPHKGSATYDAVLGWARSALGEDVHGDRAELLELVARAQSISELVELAARARSVAPSIDPEAEEWALPNGAAQGGDPLTTAVFEIEHGAGRDIFLRVRGMLTSDPLRVGNVMYLPGPQRIVIVDRRSRMSAYQALIESLDVDRAPSEEGAPAAAGSQ